jgi:TRAP-type uncharacterized transport system fused permease subunit
MILIGLFFLIWFLAMSNELGTSAIWLAYLAITWITILLSTFFIIFKFLKQAPK